MKKDVVILWLQKFSTACRNNHKYNLEYCCEEKIYSSQRLKLKILHDTYTQQICFPQRPKNKFWHAA
jgi:hypothetical protein